MHAAAGCPDVLVIGATGMLGRPVVRRLVADGFRVRALVRDDERARACLPAACELARGDVLDGGALEAAMAGRDTVYVNLAAPRSVRRPDIERSAAEPIVAAARAAGVRHLLKISFMGVPQASDLWWQIGHKAESERVFAAGGIDWTIFQPTWFMESLALFRAGRRLVLPRTPARPIHWISGDDYARQVAAALRAPAARNRAYVIQGPQPLTFRQAADRFAAAWRPRPLRVVEIPPALVRAVAPFLADARYLLDLIEVTFETNVAFEADDAWADLGKPTMTIEGYVESMLETGDVPRK